MLKKNTLCPSNGVLTHAHGSDFQVRVPSCAFQNMNSHVSHPSSHQCAGVRHDSSTHNQNDGVMKGGFSMSEQLKLEYVAPHLEPQPDYQFVTGLSTIIDSFISEDFEAEEQ
jgi:hypothetical protein